MKSIAVIVVQPGDSWLELLSLTDLIWRCDIHILLHPYIYIYSYFSMSQVQCRLISFLLVTEAPDRCTWKIGLTRIDRGYTSLLESDDIHWGFWYGSQTKVREINSLNLDRYRSNFTSVFFKLILGIDTLSAYCEISLRWMPQKSINDKPTNVQVMAWCHQVTSRYLS